MRPDDIFELPTWFLKEITIIAPSSSLVPTKSSVRFDISLEAAKHNASLLREIDYDFQSFFLAQAGTTLAFGSEFRPGEQLQPLLHHHPGFDKLANILVTGMLYRYAREIAEIKRENEVIASNARPRQPQISPGRTSYSGTTFIQGQSPWIFNGDSDRSSSTHPKCNGSTSGLAKQWTLDEKGNRKIKYRITQDL